MRIRLGAEAGRGSGALKETSGLIDDRRIADDGLALTAGASSRQEFR
jgi:hypothetical protein